MKYTFIGGGAVEATSASEVVEAMRMQSRTPSATQAAFMADTARRCHLQNLAVVRTDSPETFIADLEAGGFLQKVDN